MYHGKYADAAEYLANFAARQQSQLQTQLPLPPQKQPQNLFTSWKHQILQLEKSRLPQQQKQYDRHANTNSTKPPPPPGTPPKYAKRISLVNDSKSLSLSIHSPESSPKLRLPQLEQRYNTLVQQAEKMKLMVAFGERERQQLTLELNKLEEEYQKLKKKHEQCLVYSNQIKDMSEDDESYFNHNAESFSAKEKYYIQTMKNLQQALKSCTEKLSLAQQNNKEKQSQQVVVAERDALLDYSRDIEDQLVQKAMWIWKAIQ